MSDRLEAEGRLAAARTAADAGAAVALDWWHRLPELTIEEKADPGDLVSRADRETEHAIRETLAHLCPDDAVLGEEHGRTGGSTGVEWMVDPIDGTTNYLYGRPDWAVSVAAVATEDRAVLVGVVVEPASGHVTVARRGGGTVHNGRPATVSGVDHLARALVELNLGRAAQRDLAGRMIDGLLPHTRDLRRGGSAACALAQVATGRADAVWAPGLSPWDFAAGLLLVHEAGGSVGDLTAPTAAVCPGSGDVLASNPTLWPLLCDLLRPVYRSEDR